jgi:hypothetical protein
LAREISQSLRLKRSEVDLVGFRLRAAIAELDGLAVAELPAPERTLRDARHLRWQLQSRLPGDEGRLAYECSTAARALRIRRPPGSAGAARMPARDMVLANATSAASFAAGGRTVVALCGALRRPAA